jgi:hypothetical protein
MFLSLTGLVREEGIPVLEVCRLGLRANNSQWTEMRKIYSQQIKYSIWSTSSNAFDQRTVNEHGIYVRSLTSALPIEQSEIAEATLTVSNSYVDSLT